MALNHKTKICYRCPERLWKSIKWIELRDKEKDIHKLLDKLIKIGIEVDKNEQKKD